MNQFIEVTKGKPTKDGFIELFNGTKGGMCNTVFVNEKYPELVERLLTNGGLPRR